MDTVYGLQISNLRVMPEEMVIKAAQDMEKEDPENNFSMLLKGAQSFRMVGLTPIFLCDINMQNLMVTTEEKLRKKYH